MTRTLSWESRTRSRAWRTMANKHSKLSNNVHKTSSLLPARKLDSMPHHLASTTTRSSMASHSSSKCQGLAYTRVWKEARGHRLSTSQEIKTWSTRLCSTQVRNVSNQRELESTRPQALRMSLDQAHTSTTRTLWLRRVSTCLWNTPTSFERSEWTGFWTNLDRVEEEEKR